MRERRKGEAVKVWEEGVGAAMEDGL